MINVALKLKDGAFHRDAVTDLGEWLAWALNPKGIEDVRWVMVNGQIIYDAR